MQSSPQPKMPVIFYQTPAGGDAVLDWLKSLEQGERAAIGQDLMRVQFRWPVGMPFCRPMGDGLWEVRSHLPSGNIARIMFCIVENHILALHGFIKKTQKTPQDDLKLAIKRKQEFLGKQGMS